MRPIILRREADANYPLMHETGVLSRAHVAHVVVAARKDEVVQGAASTLQPCSHRLPSRVHQLELNRSLGLLLNDDRAVAQTLARDNISDPHPNHITAAELAIDSEVKQGLGRVVACADRARSGWP